MRREEDVGHRLVTQAVQPVGPEQHEPTPGMPPRQPVEGGRGRRVERLEDGAGRLDGIEGSEGPEIREGGAADESGAKGPPHPVASPEDRAERCQDPQARVALARRSPCEESSETTQLARIAAATPANRVGDIRKGASRRIAIKKRKMSKPAADHIRFAGTPGDLDRRMQTREQPRRPSARCRSDESTSGRCSRASYGCATVSGPSLYGARGITGLSLHGTGRSLGGPSGGGGAWE